MARLVGFLEDVLAVLIKLAGRGIERDGDFFSRLVSGLRDGFEDDFNGLDIRLHRRREAAFVADCGVVAALFEHAFQGVEDLDAPAQRLGKRFRSYRHHHEFLKVHVVVGVSAAVEDVHHRRGQNVGAGAAEIAIERQAECVAEARAAAIETARMAFAPRRPLFSVPSSSIIF